MLLTNTLSAPEATDRGYLLHEHPRAGDQALAPLREFALGVEALERFVREEPRYRVHACVFAGLALESKAVDPKL